MIFGLIIIIAGVGWSLCQAIETAADKIVDALDRRNP